jgi:hypothetical protein
LKANSIRDLAVNGQDRKRSNEPYS